MEKKTLTLETIIENYFNNMQIRNSLSAEKDVIEDTAIQDKLEAKRRMDAKTSAVKEKYWDERNKIEGTATALVTPIKQLIKDLWPTIESTERMFDYLNHKEKIELKTRPDDIVIETYQEMEIVALGELYADEFTLIKLFAVPNDRPKNKWTLMAYGETILSGIVDLPYSYGGVSIKKNVCIRKELKHLPTVEALKTYIKRKRKTLMANEREGYQVVKKAYLDTIKNYTLDDLKPLLEPRVVSSEEAPRVFKVDTYNNSTTYRLYQGFYYTSGAETPDDFIHMFDYITVDDEVYKRCCVPEQLKISQTGNTLFGDWWSMSITKDRGDIIFNRENFDRELTEANKRIGKDNINRRKPISFTPPKVEWFG